MCWSQSRAAAAASHHRNQTLHKCPALPVLPPYQIASAAAAAAAVVGLHTSSLFARCYSASPVAFISTLVSSLYQFTNSVSNPRLLVFFLSPWLPSSLLVFLPSLFSSSSLHHLSPEPSLLLTHHHLLVEPCSLAVKQPVMNTASEAIRAILQHLFDSCYVMLMYSNISFNSIEPF